ncbi:MAG: hypothetical protein WCX59_04705 [Anaerovoracaceae bacterium]|jgi:hypothetical protein
MPGLFGYGRILFFLIPVLFAIGLYISFDKERWGGIIMLLSVVVYNALLISAYGLNSLSDIGYWYLLIPAIIPIFLAGRKAENREKKEVVE